MLAALNPFSHRDVPRMSRPNYAAELRHMLFWGIFAGLVEGNTSSIVASKTFHGSEFLTTVVWSTPMLANTLSLVWSGLIRGRPRRRLFVLLSGGSALAFMSVAFTPSDWQPWGAWIFAGQVAVARILLAGQVNVRTSIWSANYPDSHRARISGRLQNVRFATGLLASLAVMNAFDVSPEHYRWVYPGVGAIGLLALLPIRGMRVRGEARHLRSALSASAGPAVRVTAHGAAPEAMPRRASAGAAIWANLRESAAILRKDREFARYCGAQYLLGSANFMVDPVLLIVFTKQLGYSYLKVGVLMEQLPQFVLLLTIGAWARYFDRVGVLRFRVVNTAVWLGSCVAAAGGVALLSMGENGAVAAVALIIVARILNGVGRSGGAIAWNLGHLHFADRHQADLYMGIHVALTGIRGLIMPFIAVGIHDMFGWWSLAVASVLCAMAARQFHRLAREERRSL